MDVNLREELLPGVRNGQKVIEVIGAPLDGIANSGDRWYITSWGRGDVEALIPSLDDDWVYVTIDARGPDAVSAAESYEDDALPDIAESVYLELQSRLADEDSFIHEQISKKPSEPQQFATYKSM